MLRAEINARIVDPVSASVEWTPMGARGIGIKKIEKTATEGLVDTYTVTYTDGATYQYQVRNGEQGKPGKDFEYEDFTEEQLEALRGAPGKPFTYDDFTPEQLEELKGAPGKDFKYEDFTPEQLEELRGKQGKPGAVFTPKVSTDGEISWTNNADLENPTPVNIRGPKGEQGAGFVVNDNFVSLGALELAVPNPEPGDAYGVGLEAPYDIYIYGKTSGWTNHGKLQGAKGEKGDPFTFDDFTEAQLEALKGATGTTFTPEVSEEGELSWSNDGGKQNPEPVNIKGAPGDPGKTPVRGEDYWTAEDQQKIVNDVLAALPSAERVSY